MRSRSKVLVFVSLLALAIVLVNSISRSVHFRVDLTSDDRYTLSRATLDMLEQLPEAVTVTAYFTEDLRPDLALVREELKDLLVEYNQRSGGNVVFEFIDPSAADSLEAQAQENGVSWVLVNTREKDKAEQVKAYMGAVVRMGEQSAAIPLLQPESAIEWELSSAMKRVSFKDKPVVGLVMGHGEPGMNLLPQLERSLSVLYGVEPMAIFDSFPIHDRFSALLWLDPRDSIPVAHLQRLDEFLAKGRGLVIAYSKVTSDLGASPVIDVRNSPMEIWLAGKGLKVGNEAVIDASCGQVQVLQQRGMYTMQVPVSFPYFPLITTFGDHPISGGLEAVLLQFSTSLSFQGDTSAVRYSPLLVSSPKTGLLQVPHIIDLQRQWTDAQFLSGPRTVAAALEGRLSAGAPSRMVVFANGSFALNGGGAQPTPINPDNVNVVINAVDWVTDSTGLIELRNKGVRFRQLDALTDGQRTAIKWAMLMLPMLLVLVHGLIRLRWRRRQRDQRTRPGHVQ
jgi:gliding-associated putative ABC transporter substrate-binding component GldG